MNGEQSQTMELLANCAGLIKEERIRHFETGDSYNLLDLTVTGDEECMHSIILASLLNPKGKHKQGSVFLSLFLNQCGIDNGFDAKSAYVTCEKDLGHIVNDGENSSGGRIDIFLEDKFKHRIIIENKWNARDQKHQLIRYHNYDEQATILYLNRFGHSPSKSSIGKNLNVDTDYKVISYKSEINLWLKACIASVKEKAYLSVAIDSYRKLLARLNMTGEDNKILAEIQSSKESIAAAFEISKALDDLKKKGQLFFWTELFNLLNKTDGFEPEICTIKGGVSKSLEKLSEAIEEYVNKDASRKEYRYYGIRVKIGNYSGEDVYAAILVNTNLYFPIYAPGKAAFNELAYEFFKNSHWNHKDSDNIAWKRPGNDEKFNFRAFNNENVYTLALEDKTLVNHIYDEFLETVKVARHNLESFVKSSKFLKSF